MRDEAVRAFAPGRANLIGEHTDYNAGLALPFAIEQGVTVQACAREQDGRACACLRAVAVDLDEGDEFALTDRRPAAGWRAFVRGSVAELSAAGWPPPPALLRISGDVPRGGGLSSSAALELALCIALIELTRRSTPPPAGEPPGGLALARLCSRIENQWVGAQTGLLDQLASLYGRSDAAVLIDFLTLDIEPVALELDGWRLVVVDSGERHAHASSGYNARRAECERACALLGVGSLREADADAVALLPEPLARRVRHVLGENERVLAAVRALRDGDLPALGGLLDASHLSLRDLYEVSTPAVERTRRLTLQAGAAGARIMGGGFGGGVLALFPPSSTPPPEAIEVRPAPGAHLISDRL